MINAVEEAYLNGVIADFLGQPCPGEGWVFSNDVEAVRQLIPRFAAIVEDMILRNLIEIRDVPTGHWDDAPSLGSSEIRLILSDPATWIWSPEGDNRMIMLMTTEHADRLLGR